ncbi:helicase-related protein [Cognatiyoonia sp. IB215182]|uniref:helicase-related protein n=1 Tax=Cognatiyoonia sp. IB215182 TaxID=3097353 RepID=UPI002A0FC5FB|nr:helicase-related protein [Cognatiyoonia sp. IB215182]MDX8351652.1 helicase-related protein [Cognatiyoonia sp. IB215182]
MEKNGLAADAIHGNKPQGQYDRTPKAAKQGNVHVLVATDVAGYGIHIPDVWFV